MDRVFLSLFVASVLMAGVAQTHAQTASAKLGSKPLVTVNLNTATATELEGLPGIGPSTAARIVEYRQKNGPFKKIEETQEFWTLRVLWALFWGCGSSESLRPSLEVARMLRKSHQVSALVGAVVGASTTWDEPAPQPDPG